MIFKLQLPLSSTQANAPVLAYTEGRRNRRDVTL